MKNIYEKKSIQDKVLVIRKLVNLQDGWLIVKYLSDFQDLVNKFSTMKITLDDELWVLLLLSFLQDSWEILMMSLSNFAPNGVLSLLLVKNSLYDETI